jgi:tetratricopeptide (TPR) repeat protein
MNQISMRNPSIRAWQLEFRETKRIWPVLNGQSCPRNRTLASFSVCFRVGHRLLELRYPPGYHGTMSLGVIAPTESTEKAPPLKDADDSRRNALLLLLGALPYLLTLRNGFIYDDFQQILNNPYIHSFHHLGALLGTTAWSFQGAEGGLNYYRPLMSVFFLLCWSVSGPIPLAYHLFNVTLHAANVTLVYWVTGQLWEDSEVAFTAAVIFAVHPIHTESVAWISGVTDLQLTFFYLLAFGLYLRAHRPDAPRFTRVAMVASFALALLSKETAITLPAVVLIYEHIYSGEAMPGSEPFRNRVRRYGPLWLMAGLYMVARGFLLGGLPHSIAWHAMNFREAMLSGIAAAGLYLGKLVWPANLHLTYPLHRSESLTEVPVLMAMVGLCICALLFNLLWKRARLATFGLAWLVLTIAPVLNIRWIPTPFAERYLYLPSVGFCWLLACSFIWTWRKLSRADDALARAGFACVVGLALLVCIVRVEARNLEWHDQKTFVEREVTANPDVGRLHDNLGSLYWQGGDTAAAEHEWNTALLLDPDDEVAFTQIASLRTQEKRYSEAVALFQKAIRLRPTFAMAHLGLGDTDADVGDGTGAESEYREVVRLAPADARARNLLGQLLYDERRWNEAQDQFRASVSIELSQQACDRLGDLASARGDNESAIRDYTQATSLEPFDHHAHIRLGDLYAAAGRASEAVREYQDGLVTNPNDSHALTAVHKLQNSHRRD